MEENQKMAPRNLPKTVHIEARADVERPISHLAILIGSLGTKSLVVNTKRPWHLSILPWLPESPFTVHTCRCAESCPKERFYKPFKRSLHDQTGFEENNGQLYKEHRSM